MICLKLSMLFSERDFNTIFLKIKAQTIIFYDFHGISSMPVSRATFRERT